MGRVSVSATILPGASSAWKDAEACVTQGTLWLRDKAKLQIVRRVRRLQRLWKAQSVLDIGCGTGQYCGALKVCRYLGVDQSVEMLRVARDLNPEAQFVEGYGESIVVAESFDMGILMHVVQHVEDGPSFLRCVLNRFDCRRWVFSILTVPGTEPKTFNIGDAPAARALPLAEAMALIPDLGWEIEGSELDPSVGVEEAQELLVWTAPRT